MKVTPPQVPTPGIAGGENEKAMPSADFAQFLRDVRADGVVLLLGFFALVPRLFGDKEERAIGILHAAEQD